MKIRITKNLGYEIQPRKRDKNPFYNPEAAQALKELRGAIHEAVKPLMDWLEKALTRKK